MFTRVKKHRNTRSSIYSGYLLPIILFLSVAIMTVGATGFQIVLQSSQNLNQQYYQQLATEAAQAGARAMLDCTKNGVSTWPSLAPNTTCTGTADSSPAYVAKDNNWTSTFTVSTPTGTDPKSAVSTGRVTLQTSPTSTVIAAEKTIKISSGNTLTTTASKTIGNISTSGLHSCAVGSSPGSTASNAYCWGLDHCNELGRISSGCPGNIFSSPKVAYPIAVPASTSDPLNGKTVTSISTGTLGRTCAVAYTTSAADAGVYCWGPRGETYTQVIAPTLINNGALAGKTVKTVDASANHACALAYVTAGDPAATQAYCWGSNGYGQLGNGSTTMNYTAPVLVTGLSGKTVTSVSTGYDFSCALAYTTATENASNAKPYCWGSNRYGQLGVNSNSPTFRSTAGAVFATGVLSGKTITTISSSESHQSECSGYDGDGNCIGQYEVASGQSCVIAFPLGQPQLASPYCWGGNFNGEMGNGSTTYQYTTPTAASTDSSSSLNGKVVTSISAGEAYTCAVAYPVGNPLQSAAHCWGYNMCGRLGIGQGSCAAGGLVARKPVAVSVTSGSALSGKIVTDISAGMQTTCAMAQETSVDSSRAYCWGSTVNGEVGNGASGTSGIYNKSFNLPQAVDVSANSAIGQTTVTVPNGSIFY